LRHHPLVSLVLGPALVFGSTTSMVLAVQGSEYADDKGLPWWTPPSLFVALSLYFAFHEIGLLSRSI
jgi:hypothetical protein